MEKEAIHMPALPAAALRASLTSHWPEHNPVSALVSKGSWKNVAFILDSHMPGFYLCRRKEEADFKEGARSLCLKDHLSQYYLHT